MQMLGDVADAISTFMPTHIFTGGTSLDTHGDHSQTYLTVMEAISYVQWSLPGTLHVSTVV